MIPGFTVWLYRRHVAFLLLNFLTYKIRGLNYMVSEFSPSFKNLRTVVNG